MQCHSVKTSLPPLLENGPTAETVAQNLDTKGVDNSPVPSTATSWDEENDETTEANEEEPIAAASEAKRTFFIELSCQGC